MDNPLPDVAKGVIDGLKEGLPTCNAVVMIQEPDGGIYYSSSFATPLELANLVSCVAWQMAQRIDPPVKPTHAAPGTVQ